MGDGLGDKEKVGDAFEGGGDFRFGLEICNRLKAEGLGVPVIYQDMGSRKVNKIDLRHIGDSDESFRLRDQSDERLLGIVLRVGTQDNEFVFISAGEDRGMVFKDDDERRKQIYNNIAEPYVLIGNTRSFAGMVASYASNDSKRVQIILDEDTHPDKFVEVVEMAIKDTRQRLREVRQRRTETRENILQRLYGGE